MIIANYKGATYSANLVGNNVTLVTHKKNKANKDFESKRDYFTKTTILDDPELTGLYIVHFYIHYADSVEGTKWWLINREAPLGLDWNVAENQVVIDVPHDAKDESWVQYNEGAAAKKVNLADCTGFLAKKTYVKHNGELIELTEEVYMPIDGFKEMLEKSR